MAVNLVKQINQNNVQSVQLQRKEKAKLPEFKLDTFEKQDKKSNKGLIIAGSVGAGLVGLGAFLLLAKSGKLGDSCQEFVNKIFKSNACEPPETKIDTDNLTKNMPTEPIKKSDGIIETAGKKVKKIFEEPELSKDSDFDINAKISDDANEDVQKWMEYRNGLPKYNAQISNGKDTGKTIRINTEFTDFEIKPHTYNENNATYISIRRNSQLTHRREYFGFKDHKIDDGKLKSVNGSAFLNNVDIEYNPISIGRTKDGKRVVSFAFYDGSNDGTRNSFSKVTLVSETEEFTQAQKDVIKIYSKDGTKCLTQDGNNPLALARAQEEEIIGGKAQKLKFNYNTLLSAIQTWADRLGDDFDFTKAVEEFSK